MYIDNTRSNACHAAIIEWSVQQEVKDMNTVLRVYVDRAMLWDKFLVAYFGCKADAYGNLPCDNGKICDKCKHVALKFEAYVEQYEKAEKQRLSYMATVDYRNKHTRRNYY